MKMPMHVFDIQINQRKQKSTGFHGELFQRVFMDNLVEPTKLLYG